MLRKRRREKALRRAVEEVERGSVGSRGGVESREGIVLESKVEVLIEEEAWAVEDGRKGMSLPRRMW